MPRLKQLTEVFVQVADSLIDDFDVIDFLQQLSVRCVELLDVAAVGVLVADEHGALRTVAASDERAMLLEIFSAQQEQGPCVESYKSGTARTHINLTDPMATRDWPQFAVRARRAGFTVTHAIPLRLRGRLIGAMGLFQTDPAPITGEDITLARALADLATIAIIQQRTLDHSETERGQLQHALTSRITVEQVKGFLAERWQIPVDDAFAAFRAHARAHHHKLTQLALAIINGDVDTDEIPHPQSLVPPGGGTQRQSTRADAPLLMSDAQREAERLVAVRRYAILDTPPDGAFDRVAALAVRIFDVPIASVTIVDEDRVWFKTAHGLPHGLCEIPRAPGLCASVVLHDGPQVFADTRNDPDLADHPAITELGVGFYAGAPLTTADGHHLGTVNVMDTEPRNFSDADLSTLSDLAAVVMDELELRLTAMRAIQLEHELRLRAEAETEHLATVNSALQATLLPPVLSAVPGLEIAALYHIASPDNVGGDFYDLFPLDNGRWAFFLGDVCGKGIAAAALTSLTRYTLRAAAVYDPDPVAVLHNLNTVLNHEYAGDDPRFCTVVFGLLTPRPDNGFTLTLAGGGHPPALLIRADGRVCRVDLPGGQLIGALPDPHIATATHTLAPGDAVLLYTDGLTEARTGPGSASMYGEDRLHALAGMLATEDAPAVIKALQAVLVGFGTGLSDDAAVLALTVPPLASASSPRIG